MTDAKTADQRTELEYQVIGAMVHSKETAAVCLPVLSREDFANEALGAVFAAVRELFNRSAPIDRMTVVQEIGNDRFSELIQAALSVRVPHGNAEYYAAMLRDRARLDRIRTGALAITTADTIDEARTRADAINAELVTRRQWNAVPMMDAFSRFCDRHAETKTPEFLDFGFPKLKQRLFLERGDFIIIAGEPSSGKTSLACQIAVTLAGSCRVGFFTLETTSEKLTDRIMAQLTGIPLEQIKKNLLKEAEWKKIGETAQNASRLTLEQIPAAGMTVGDIQSYSIAHRYDVIFVDYLQIVTPANPRLQRYEQVTQISMGLHTMAQQAGIAVIALAQLSRPDKTKSRKSPTPPGMHDLRESGQIEQDADAVLLLYHRDPNDNTGPRMLKIAKNKEGERADFQLDFDGRTQTFRESNTTRKDIRRVAKEAAREAKEQQKSMQVTFEELNREDGGELPF